MIDMDQARELIGRELRTNDGTKIGKIGQVYVDDYHDAPEWVTVKTGLFGSNQSFVPLAESTLSGDGLVVPYTKDQIKGAPNVSEDGHLSQEQERELYEHYDVPYTTEGSTFADTGAVEGRSSDTDSGTAQYGTTQSDVTQSDTTQSGTTQSGTAQSGTTGYGAATAGTTSSQYSSESAGTVGRDTSGPITDDAMTRSEQRLDVGTERVETGRARLRKWVEEEHVQVDVPVTREKAVLVTEPITDANVGDALDGPELSGEEHEVTLTEERPVVRKETVPVERVRLEKDVETDQRTVEETVGKERIDVDGDVDTAGRHAR